MASGRSDWPSVKTSVSAYATNTAPVPPGAAPLRQGTVMDRPVSRNGVRPDGLGSPAAWRCSVR